MRLQVNGLNLNLTDNLLDHVDRRFRFALDRMEARVSSVTVRLADENGPRGGRDKQCRVLVTMTTGETIVLNEKGDDIHRVVDRASEKTKRLVNKRIDKKRNKRRKDMRIATGTDGPDEAEEADEFEYE